MQQEIEAKFLNINHDNIRLKLKELGAEMKYPMRMMRRVLFDYPDARFEKQNPQQLLRVRDEGEKITITYKNTGGGKYSQEIETTVGSYDKIIELLTAIGLIQYVSQESKREAWHYKNTEVTLDLWPWLNPYIEVEGQDEEAIKTVAKDLGLDWNNAKFGRIDEAYKAQYLGMKDGDSIIMVPDVRFDMPLPQFFKDRQQ